LKCCSGGGRGGWSEEGWQEGARGMRFVRARDGDGCRIERGEGWRMGGKEGEREGTREVVEREREWEYI